MLLFVTDVLSTATLNESALQRYIVGEMTRVRFSARQMGQGGHGNGDNGMGVRWISERRRAPRG